jgi:hypothetical protein
MTLVILRAFLNFAEEKVDDAIGQPTQAETEP